MQLTVLSSSSLGNCYILENQNEALLIEAGLRFYEVKKALRFNIAKITGCLVTHEHGDHSKYIEEYLSAGIPVYTSAGTIEGVKWKKERRPIQINHAQTFQIGGFRCMGFDVQHDCNQPFGFLVQHTDIGKLLFLTDTYYSDYTFKGLNHILVEANYCNHILQENINKGTIHPAQVHRLRHSHMSLQTCKGLLSSNDLSHVQNIVLLHLSDRNSNAAQFREEIQTQTGLPVYVADKGLTINLKSLHG